MNNDKKSHRKTLEDMRNICITHHSDNTDGMRVCIINEEFKQGFEFMRDYPKSVTFFGSARLDEHHPAYQHAVSLASKLAEQGYAIVSGGGSGIMEAANKGAHLSNGRSIGISVELPNEQVTNSYVSDNIDFQHLFSRKVTLAYSAEAYIYFTGGFGTLDELFEILTLKQTKKIPPVPIILFGKKFWEPLEEYLRTNLLANNTISPEDLDLYIITDNEDMVVRTILDAPIRTEIDINHSN